MKRSSSSHIPGLGDIPVVGRLFGSMHKTNDKTEIVLSITPRIIRSQPRPSSRDTEFWYGTESSIRSAPLGASSAASGTVAGTPAAGAAGAAVNLSAADVASESVAPPAPVDAAPAVLTAPPARSTPSIPGAPAISWDAPGQTGVGQDFDVTVRFSGGDAMKSLRAQLRYDPAVLVLQSAEAGDVVPADLQATSIPRINQIAGVVQFVVSASAENPVSGEGGLIVLHFRATTPNPATKVSLQLAAVGTSGATMPPKVQEPLTIVVTP